MPGMSRVTRASFAGLLVGEDGMGAGELVGEAFAVGEGVAVAADGEGDEFAAPRLDRKVATESSAAIVS